MLKTKEQRTEKIVKKEEIVKKITRQNAFGMKIQNAAEMTANSATQKRCAKTIINETENKEKNAHITTQEKTAHTGSLGTAREDTTAH